MRQPSAIPPGKSKQGQARKHIVRIGGGEAGRLFGPITTTIHLGTGSGPNWEGRRTKVRFNPSEYRRAAERVFILRKLRRKQREKSPAEGLK